MEETVGTEMAGGQPPEDARRSCLVAPDGKVLEVGDDWSRAFGLTQERARGKELAELFPEDREIFLALLAQAREQAGLSIRRLTVAARDARIWWSGRLFPMHMEDGTGVRIDLTGSGREADEEPETLVRPIDEGIGPLGPERGYRSLIEGAGEIVWWLDARGEATTASTAWMAFTGQREEEVLGRGYMDAIHEDDRASVVAGWQEHAARGRSLESECRLRRRDGAWRRMIFRTIPFMSKDGTFQGCVGRSIDVTDQREAEEALRESMERNDRNRAELEAVFHAMSEGVFVVDQSGTGVFANDAQGRMLGFPDGQALLRKAHEMLENPGGDSSDSSSTGFELFELDGRPIPRPEWPDFQAMSGRQVVNRQLITRNPRLGVARVLNVNASPVRDANGDQILSVTISRDITDIYEAERKVQENEELFRALADNIAQLVWVANETGQAHWLNRRWADYTGASGDDLAGDGWRAHFHPEHAERIADGIRRSVETGSPWEETSPLRSADGTYRWFLWRAVPIRDEAAGVSRWFGTGTDVDDLHRIEEELREADRRKSQFLTVLSHELRNPLSSIRNGTYLLTRAPPGSPQAVRATEMIERQTDKLSGFVDDVLDVTRIARGKVDLELENVDLREIVLSLCEADRPLFAKGHIELGVECTRDPVWVCADRSRLSQAIEQLVENAAKFTPPEGRVHVRVTTLGWQATVSIKDTGVGIEPALLERLFSPFSQADTSLARTQSGLGLGLALARGLVELHGGSVRAASEGQGKGAEFTVELPVASGR